MQCHHPAAVRQPFNWPNPKVTISRCRTKLFTDGGKRIAAALGNKKFCILRNHGLLTVGRSVEESVGWFVMAERVAEVHVKAPNARSISDEAAALAASTLAVHSVGWRMFQWLQRSLVPDRSVVD